jgi:hypothetical protein
MVGGNQYLLQPFMADLYVLPTGGQPVSVAFSQVPGGLISASTGSFCTATWYLPSDQISDAFPIALTAAAITSAISGVIGTYQALTPNQLGTGADGAVVISGNTTLTRNMNYSSLTVNAGVTLETGSFIIYCTGTVMVNGTIDNSGQPGTNHGTGAPSGAFFGGGAGNTGNASGGAPPGGTVQGGAGGGDINSVGTTTVIGPPSGLSLQGLLSNTYGGGAGGSAYESSGSNTQVGGGGGGVVMIFCNILAGAGTISANGGAGALNGNSGPAADAGGGGGGIVFVACAAGSTFAGVLSTAGGAPANYAFGTATAGKAGSTVLII